MLVLMSNVSIHTARNYIKCLYMPKIQVIARHCMTYLLNWRRDNNSLGNGLLLFYFAAVSLYYC